MSFLKWSFRGLLLVVVAFWSSYVSFAQGITRTEDSTAKKQMKQALEAEVDNKFTPNRNQGVERTNASYEPSWDSLARHETPKWFEDAVLGINFH